MVKQKFAQQARAHVNEQDALGWYLRNSFAMDETLRKLHVENPKCAEEFEKAYGIIRIEMEERSRKKLEEIG